MLQLPVKAASERLQLPASASRERLQLPLTRFKLTATTLILAVLCGVSSLQPAIAGTLPSQPNLSFQTSSRERVPGIGDWYTTRTSASTDRVHRILVEVSQGLLDANGVVVNVQVFDAENNGNLDEVDGTLNNAGGTGDPARFELRASNGTTVLDSRTVASGAADNTTLSFSISTPGSYQLVVVNGAFPISGDVATALNDDDNTYSVSIPGNSTLIGQFQGTFSPTAAFPGALNFYFLVGPGEPNLRLRNFDLDGGPAVAYTRPPSNGGGTIAGTTSGNGIWNGAGTLDVGQDDVTIAPARPYLDAGQWGLSVSNIAANNQFVLEANAGVDRLVVLDQPAGTADAGNFRITPDGTLPGTLNQPTDHPFSVTNFFFTNDIVNFSLSGTSPNYTAVIIDAATGNPVVDSDNDGTTAGGVKRVDTDILRPGQTKNYILRVTPSAGAGPSDTTRVNGISFMDERIAPGVLTTLFVNKTTQLTSSTNVSGTLYNDANRNSVLDNGEVGLATTGFFVKLVPTAGGNAVAAAAVNAGNGTYSILGVTPGSYNLVLDNNNTLSDTTPTVPTGAAGTEAPTGIRAVTVPTAGAVDQNFGRFGGAVITGRVFRDDGSGGGVANNGVVDGGEVGIAGVVVRAQNSAGNVTFDTTTTDASGNYTLYAPAAGAAIRVIETNLSGFRSTGATVGNSGGTYALATDATTFTPVAGTTYTPLNFGDVPPSIFSVDNTRTASAGETVIMPHVFTAGTAGTLNFSLSATSDPSTGWSNLLFRDLNADGILQPNEPQITGPIAVTAGQQIAVLTKVFTPLGAPINSQQALQVTAALTYANQPSQIESTTRTDLVTIAAGSGLILTKSVDRTTARAGDDITYTITYRNSGNDTLRNLVVNDSTPAFTTFRSGATGTLPAGITGVTTIFPAVGVAGALRWTFGGGLAPGASGTVTFVVRLQ